MTVDRWLAVIGLVTALLGIPISVLISRHYYRRSEKRRRPTFVIEQTWALADPGLTKNVQGLSVLCDGEGVGKEGISQAKIYFWNSGSQAIGVDEVLQPYSISMPVRILSCWVKKVSREVVQLDAAKESPNKVILKFSLLEPGDGGTLIIVYDGPPKTPIDFDGITLDSPKPTVLPPHYFYSLPKSKRVMQSYGMIVLLPVAVVIVALVLTLIVLGPFAAISALIHKFFEKKLADKIVDWVSTAAMASIGVWVIGSIVWPRIRRVNAPYLPPDIRG